MADQGNAGLVEEIVRGYAGRSPLGLAEMLEAGRWGLSRAQERFAEDNGVDFATYAEWWIRWAVTKAIAEAAEASSKDENCLTVETGRWPVSKPPSGDELN